MNELLLGQQASALKDSSAEKWERIYIPQLFSLWQDAFLGDDLGFSQQELK